MNDVYRLDLSDLETMRWHKVETVGEPPAPREGHVTKMIANDCMLIHGGYDQHNEISFDDCFILAGI